MATVRDGAPVEVVGLLYLGLGMMKMLYEEGFIESKGVIVENEMLSYKDWKRKIK